MTDDLSPLLESWRFNPNDENKNIRVIRGLDGKPKIQVRVRCGVFQWEYEGRPDGSTPYGYPSLLDFYRDAIEHLRRQEGPNASLKLNRTQQAEINEEIMDYYQRRILFFRLGEYRRARDDAQHNLDLMDIIREHSDDPEAIIEHEKWRPFVTMDRTRAEALMAAERGDYVGCIETIEAGIEEIAEIFRRQGREDAIEESQEIAALKDLKAQLRETYDIPLTKKEILESLREEQAKAIAEEDYERAARIRDEISHFENQEPSENP